MVKYYLVKVEESFYNANKDALKKFGKKPVCVLKVNKLIKENQRLIKELLQRELAEEENQRLIKELSQRELAEDYLKKARNILKEAQCLLKKAKKNI